MATEELIEPVEADAPIAVQPPGEYDLAGRIATGVVTGVPLLLLILAGQQAWGGALHL